MTSINAMSGISATYGAQQMSGASAANAPSDNVLRYLTAGDRQLIAQATGTKLNADGLDDQGRALAPITAFEIAIDRKNGVLPAGQPVTAGFLQQLISNQTSGGGDQSVVDQLNKMLDVVNHQQGSQQRVDIRAETTWGARGPASTANPRRLWTSRRLWFISRCKRYAIPNSKHKIHAPPRRPRSR